MQIGILRIEDVRIGEFEKRVFRQLLAEQLISGKNFEI